jgi:hypothetical protein
MLVAPAYPAGRRAAAIADHGDIREAITEASLQPVGSARWWRGLPECTAEEHRQRVTALIKQVRNSGRVLEPTGY